ncbi:MAG: CPBP family intramembrane metalloprotease [Defluviitaleaceae bacterium]|nr:CPBP family intramembrane metalloprotease [Defluviitaleaceae bacterium]
MENPYKANSFIFLLMLYQLVIAEAFGIFRGFLQSQEIILPTWIILFISQFLAFLVPCIFVAAKNPDKIRVFFPLKSIDSKNILMIAGMMIAIQPITMLISLATSSFFGNRIGDIVSGINSEGNILLSIGVVAIVPSVFEEMALRGIAFSGYRDVKITMSALINGLFFGIMHFNPQQFIYAFILGAVFCFFVYYTKSLYSAVLGHFIINASQAMINFVDTRNALPLETEAAQTFEDINSGGIIQILNMLIFPMIALVFLGAFIWIYIRFKQYNLKINPPLADEKSPSSKILTWHFWGILSIFAIIMVFQLRIS